MLGALLRLLGKGGPPREHIPRGGRKLGPWSSMQLWVSLLKLKYSELIYNVMPILERVSFNSQHEEPHLPGAARCNRFCRVPSGWNDVYRTTRAL